MDVHTAAGTGNLQAVKRVVTPANVNAKNAEGLSPLMLAVKAGHVQVFHHLLTLGADPHALNRVSVTQAGQSVLFIAAWNNQFELAQALLQLGVSVNSADQRGWTPLIISVYHNFFEMVKLLLEHGAELDHHDTVTPTQFGKRAIDRAKDPAMISLLREPASTLSKRSSASRSSPPLQQFERTSSRSAGSLEAYVQETCMLLEQKLLSEWANKISTVIEGEVSRSEGFLRQELSTLLAQASQQMYSQLLSKTLANVESECRSKGMAINPTQLHTLDWQADVALHQPTKLPLPVVETSHLVQPMPDFRLATAEPSQAKTEIFEHLNAHLSSFQEQVMAGLEETVARLLDEYFARIQGDLGQQLRQAMDRLSTGLTAQLDRAADLRQEEIKAAQRTDPFTFRPHASESEANLSGVMKSSFHSSPSRSAYAAPPERPSSASQSKERTNRLKPGFAGSKPANIPRTSVAATLQQFLKYEEMNKGSNSIQ